MSETLTIFSSADEQSLPKHPLLRSRALMSLKERVDTPLTFDELHQMAEQTENPAHARFARLVLRHRPKDWVPAEKPEPELSMTEEELVRALQGENVIER